MNQKELSTKLQTLIKHCFLFFVILLLSHSVAYAIDSQKKWTITSDSSVHDFKQQTVHYSGNVKFTTRELLIMGSKIIINKNPNGNIDKIEIIGSPAQFTQQQNEQTLQLSAENIVYLFSNQNIKAKKQVLLKQIENAVMLFKVKAESLNLLQTPTPLLTASGSPLELEIANSQQDNILAKGNSLDYKQVPQEFELTGNVKLINGRDIIKAPKIIYNNLTQVMQIPKTPNQRTEMTQSEKKNDE